jgi:sigma-B regulation protein RsbQ
VNPPSPRLDRATIGKRNNVRISGFGTQVMLFAHGFGCDQAMWRFVAPAFEPHYKVVLFDYVGCGKSDWSAYDDSRYADLRGYARDALDVIEAFDLHDVIFVGHSVSSMIGLLAAIEAPERFQRFIMIGPSPCYVNGPDYVGGFERKDIEGLLDLMEKNFIGWAAFLAPVVMKNGDRGELAQELEASFCSADPRMTRRFARATFLSDNRADLSAFGVPSLILQCSDDAVAPDAVGRYLNAALRGSELRQMDATGHCPHMSHPDETIRLMQQYLRDARS